MILFEYNYNTNHLIDCKKTTDPNIFIASKDYKVAVVQPNYWELDVIPPINHF